jgi:N-acetylglucosamine-6-sulfatase
MRNVGVMLVSVALAVGLLSFSAYTATTDDMRKAQAQTASVKPNIVFVLTDDLDKRLLTSHLSDYPNIRSLAAHGVTFDNAFVTNALCCPSRSTIFTGLYSHNHHVMDNDPPNGGAQAFRPLEPKALPVWLDNAGYHTALLGKYLNGYDESWVPPGWDTFRGKPIDDGAIPLDSDLQGPTNRMAQDAQTFLASREAQDSEPFFLELATGYPHEGWPLPQRLARLFPGERAPRPPSFNERDVSDKPGYVRRRSPLTREKRIHMDELYRDRRRKMVGVDEMVGKVVAALREEGELSSTYIVFSSDNGFHMGQHRLGEGKRLAYEEDIRVPLIVRGPGVPASVTRSGMVVNNDLAPTFAQWAQASPLLPVDGRSLVPMLRPSPPSGSAWRTALMAEAAREERMHRPAYRAVRTKNYLFVRYGNGEKELYNFDRDPYQLRSRAEEASRSLKERLRRRLSALDDCGGAGCRQAEGP